MFYNFLPLPLLVGFPQLYLGHPTTISCEECGHPLPKHYKRRDQCSPLLQPPLDETISNLDCVSYQNLKLSISPGVLQPY